MEVICSQEKEVGHFGLENKRVTPSRVTKVQPFSFEERDRQMLQHKKEFIEKVKENALIYTSQILLLNFV